MKPDRSNYEIWLTDWLDGNLDAVRTKQLMSFLDENPDLREEAESLSFTRLSPDNNLSAPKNSLKRTPEDLSLSQIEYLSVAYLEHDLSEEQIKDLKENIEAKSESRKLFETIQKTRLIPQDHRFRYKARLLRKPFAARVLRLSLIGLSAAAAAATLIVSFLVLPRSIRTENTGITMNQPVDTVLIQPGSILTYNEDINRNKKLPIKNVIPENLTEALSETSEQNSVTIPGNSEISTLSNPDVFITAVPFLSGIEIRNRIPSATLVASEIVIPERQIYDPERGRIKRFIASTFRQKILKDQGYNDAPLKSYEIAEAGIDGLNKLLGWEMALVTTSNDEGEVKSYYFSSRVLKFNAPVKKANPSL